MSHSLMAFLRYIWAPDFLWRNLEYDLYYSFSYCFA